MLGSYCTCPLLLALPGLVASKLPWNQRFSTRVISISQFICNAQCLLKWDENIF